MTEEQMKLSTDVMGADLGIISAAGYINNEGGQAIAEAAQDLMGRGCENLLIDLEGTRIINSIGVSILLEIMEQLLDKDGRMAFCNLTPTIAKTFEIMGLVQYAAIYPDRPTAQNALAENAAP